MNARRIAIYLAVFVAFNVAYGEVVDFVITHLISS